MKEAPEIHTFLTPQKESGTRIRGPIGTWPGTKGPQWRRAVMERGERPNSFLISVEKWEDDA